jgi:hypothetical protein
MPNASANDPARDGSWHDADRSLTAIPSFLSWSQTVTEPGHGRVRLAAVLRAGPGALSDRLGRTRTINMSRGRRALRGG